MDYTRMTQNGHWSGWLSVNGQRVEVGAGGTGTRDRSWGIRPVGASEPQPPHEGNSSQFFWLWTLCNFETRLPFIHNTDDGSHNPCHRLAGARGACGPREPSAPSNYSNQR